jgi:curli biogenesis system outer membrane secretion channel CsgG
MITLSYFKTIFWIFIAIFLLQGCSQNQINMTQYPLTIEEKIEIPKVCEYEYTPYFSTIAVMDFTNNSTFGKADVYDSTTTKQGSVIAGIIVNDQGAGVGAGAKSSKKTISVKREVDAKLSQTLTPLLESKIAQLSGTTLVARNDIEKINKELKLQDSGLLEPSSVVEFGKLLGARYIVTGSIDNVEINQRNNEGAAIAVNNVTSKSNDSNTQIVGLIGRVLTSFTDGILIKTTITVKILEVQSGKIVYAQTLSDDVNIGKFANPSYDVYIGGIKSAIISSLEQLHYDFSNQFILKGYITKIKSDGNNQLVQINLGKNNNIQPNQIFNVYSLEETIDPLLGTISCDKIQLPITLSVTSYISDTHSWLKPEKNDTTLKLLQLVESSKTQRGFFDF